tara:strand:+ start:221 stop:361 length:141 start_codon:yes stop_codon:yes gene_type:complete
MNKINNDKEWKMQCDFAWEHCKWWYVMTKEQKIRYALNNYRGGSNL